MLKNKCGLVRKPNVEVMLMEKQDALTVLETDLAKEFFTRHTSTFLRKLIDEFQKLQGRTVPMHRAYALGSPAFNREEAYDVLKALRDRKILRFSVQHGITIIDAHSQNIEE